MVSSLLLLVTAFQSAQAAPAKTPELLARRSAEDYGKTWKKISDDISDRFYARNNRKEEMNKILAKYAPLAKAAEDDYQFEIQVEEMIHEFGDSHFDLYTRLDQGYYMMDGLARGEKAESAPVIGAWFRQMRDGYTVQMVLEGSEAQKAGLRQGDKIDAADGKAFQPILSFAGKQGKPVQLDVEREGRHFEKTVTPKNELLMDMFLKATRDSAHIIEAKGKKLAYVHLWTQANDDFRSALEGMVYGKFANTDGFILDLRDGFGGRPERFADPFFRPDVTIKWDYSGRMSQTQHFGYGKPLVVLINGGSRSAKEILSYILKSSKRATLIGTTTAGNVLGTAPTRVSDWAILELPSVDVIVNGDRLEKNGVKPDIEVKDGFDKDGKDLVIQRAVDFLVGRH